MPVMQFEGNNKTITIYSDAENKGKERQPLHLVKWNGSVGKLRVFDPRFVRDNVT